jgi:hypothetical protein
MTPLALLAQTVRRAITEGSVTAAGVQELRQLALTVLPDDALSASEIRDSLAWALNDPPDARSFATDSGIGASRAL